MKTTEEKTTLNPNAAHAARRKLEDAAPEMFRVISMLKDWIDEGAQEIHFAALMPCGDDREEDLEDAVRAAFEKASR